MHDVFFCDPLNQLLFVSKSPRQQHGVQRRVTLQREVHLWADGVLERIDLAGTSMSSHLSFVTAAGVTLVLSE